MTIGIVAVMQGNVFSAVITGIIWLGFGFLVNSDVAQIFTEAARAVNAIPESAGAAGVSCLLVGHNFFGWLVYKAFAAPEAIRMFTIAAAFCLLLYRLLLLPEVPQSMAVGCRGN